MLLELSLLASSLNRRYILQLSSLCIKEASTSESELPLLPAHFSTRKDHQPVFNPAALADPSISTGIALIIYYVKFDIELHWYKNAIATRHHLKERFIIERPGRRSVVSKAFPSPHSLVRSAFADQPLNAGFCFVS
jgi:hypothetical protein